MKLKMQRERKVQNIDQKNLVWFISVGLYIRQVQETTAEAASTICENQDFLFVLFGWAGAKIIFHKNKKQKNGKCQRKTPNNNKNHMIDFCFQQFLSASRKVSEEQWTLFILVVFRLVQYLGHIFWFT